jgi:hypothetical protein
MFHSDLCPQKLRYTIPRFCKFASKYLLIEAFPRYSLGCMFLRHQYTGTSVAQIGVHIKGAEAFECSAVMNVM